METTPMAFDPAEFDFTNLEPYEIPVRLPKDPMPYLLCEATEPDAVRFRRANIAAVSYGPDGTQSLRENQADLEPLLIGMCLWTTKDGAKHQRVGKEVIERIPARVATQLYVKAREISGLNGDELTEASIQKKIDGLAELLSRMKAARGGEDGSAAGKPQ